VPKNKINFSYTPNWFSFQAILTSAETPEKLKPPAGTSIQLQKFMPSNLPQNMIFSPPFHRKPAKNKVL
jgi:hypothetical protein